jgi:hypothetical protein
MKDHLIHPIPWCLGIKGNNQNPHQMMRKKRVPTTKLLPPEVKVVPGVRKAQQAGHNYYRHLPHELVGYASAISTWVKQAFHWRKVLQARGNGLIRRGVEIGEYDGTSKSGARMFNCECCLDILG